MALPPVGAQVTLQGAQAFDAACKAAVASITQLDKSIQQMANNVTASTTAAGKSSSSFFKTLETGSKSALSAVDSAAKGIGTAFVSTAGIIAGSITAIDGAIAGLVTTTAVMGANFVQNMTNAGVAVNATNSDMESMNSTVLEMGRKWNISIREIEKAVPIYMRAGGSVEGLNKGVLDQAVALAVASAGELKLEQAIMMVTGGLGAFNIRAEEASRITNAVTAAANASAISYKDIYRTLPQAASVYAALGYSEKDLLATTAILGQEYVRNSDAGTAMRVMLVSLMAPTKKAQEVMKETGVSLYDASGQVVPFTTFITRLSIAVKDLNENMTDEQILSMQAGQALKTMFGQDAMRAALILGKRGPEALKQFESEIDKTSAMDIAGKMLKPAVAQAQILTSQFETFGIVIGEQVEPAVRDLLTDLNLLFKSLNVNQIALIGKAFGSMISGVGFDELIAEANRMLSGGIAQAFTSFVNLLRTIRDVITGEIIPSFAYLWDSITGGASITSTFVTIFDSLSSSTKIFGDIVTFISMALGDLIESIKSTTLGAIALEIIFKGILALPLVTLVAVFVAIAAAVSQILGPILLVSLAVGAVIYAFEHWSQIVTIVNGVVASIVGTFNGIISGIREVIDPVISVVVGVFTTIASTVSTIVGGIVGVIANNFDKIVSIIAAALLLIAGYTVVNLGIAAAAWLVTFLPAVISAAAGILIQIAAILISLPIVAVVMTATAVSWAASWLVGMLPAVVTAVSGILAAILSVMAPIAILAGVAAALYLAWKTNFLGIQDFVGKVLTWVSDKIASFINWLKSLPVIGTFVEGVASSINLIGGEVSDTFNGAKDTVTDFVSSARDQFDKYTKGLSGTLPVMDEFTKKLDGIKRTNEDVAEGERLAREAQQRWNEANKVPTKTGMPAPGFPEGDDTEGKISKADELKGIIADIMRALKDMPIMTGELAEFLGKIAQEFPERLTPMLSALKSSYGILQQIADIKKQILQIDLETLAVEMRQNLIRAQMAAVQAKAKFIEVQYAQQLVTLNAAIAAIDLQIIPIRARISEIDAEINRLQRENLDLARQRAFAEIELIPYKEQLLKLDQQIQDLSWKDYNSLIAQAQAELSILPAKQKIAQIDRQINDLVNKRVALQQKESQILADRQLTLLDRQLKSTNKELDAAWQRMDVPKILNLEEQVRALEEQKSAAEENSDAIKAQIEDTQFLQDIETIRLEKEKLAYEELIKPTEDYLFSLQQQMDLTTAITDLAKLRLEAERQAVEQLMQPYKNIIDNLNLQIEAEKTRNSIRIIDLQIEKQALEDILAPLEAARQKYQDQIDIINARIIVETLAYDLQIAQYQQLDAAEEVRRTELLATKAQIEDTYTKLIQQFVNAMAQSGAFSVQEAYEVAKRLGVWNDQIAKLQEIFVAFSNIRSEADNVTKAINDIPSRKDITIVTHYVDDRSGQSSGPNPAGSGTNLPQLKEGGFVPGPYGKPILALLHGGEFVVGLKQMTPTTVNSAQVRAPARAMQNVYNTNYNVDANYSTMQSPSTIKMDLQALALKSRR